MQHLLIYWLVENGNKLFFPKRSYTFTNKCAKNVNIFAKCSLRKIFISLCESTSTFPSLKKMQYFLEEKCAKFEIWCAKMCKIRPFSYYKCLINEGRDILVGPLSEPNKLFCSIDEMFVEKCPNYIGVTWNRITLSAKTKTTIQSTKTTNQF